MPAIQPPYGPALDALEALPAWVPWVLAVLYPLAAGALCAGWGWLAGWIACRPALRLPSTAHWTERARLLFGPRVVGRQLVLLLPLIAAPAAWLVSAPLSALGWGWLAAATAVITVPVGVWLSLGIRRRLSLRPHTAGAALRESLAVWLALYPHLLVALLLAPLAGAELGPRAWAVLAVAVVVAGAALLGWGLKVARRLGLLKPAPEHVQAALERASATSGTRAAGVEVLEWSAANALAFPPVRRVVVTRGAARHLNDEELTAICQHELAHLTEGGPVVVLRAIGPVVLSAAIVLLRPLASTWGLWGGLADIAGALAVLTILRVVLRRQETRADEAGRHHEGDPGAYARALERIYQINLMPAVLPGRTRVHPHLYDRLLAAGVQPDYPRPAAPPRARRALALLLALFGLLFSLVVFALLVWVGVPVWGALAGP